MDNRTIREEIARAVFIELWNACPNGIGPIMAYEHHEDIWLKCADAVLPLITAAREEWQTVENGLPEIGEQVLIHTTDARQSVREACRAIPYEGAAEWFWMTPVSSAGRGFIILPEHVTHWRPLPLPPSQ